MPCLAIRRSLHVGRCVCVCESPRDSSIPSVSTPTPLASQGAFWIRMASKSRPPLLSSNQATFLSAICAVSLLRTRTAFAPDIRKKCVLGDLGEKRYAHKSSPGIMDMSCLVKRRFDYRLYKRGRGPQPSWEQLQKVLNSARMTS